MTTSVLFSGESFRARFTSVVLLAEMEPVSRIAFEYPIYGMDILDDGSVSVAGGGGRMKSGIPNSCVRVSSQFGSCLSALGMPDRFVS